MNESRTLYIHSNSENLCFNQIYRFNLVHHTEYNTIVAVSEAKTTIWISSIAHIAIKWFIRITFELRIFKDLHITTKSPFHRRRYVTYSLWQKIKLSQHKVLLHVFYYWNQVSLTRFRILKTTSVCCKLHIFSDTRQNQITHTNHL